VELDRDDVSEVRSDLESQRELEALHALVPHRDPLLHPRAHESLARDRERIARDLPVSGIAKVEPRPEVLDPAGREQKRACATDVQDEPREEARVVREEPARVGGNVAALVADAERRSFENREHRTER